MFKRVSGQRWRVFAFNKTNQEPVTGAEANITALLSLDYGIASSVIDTNPTEQGSGYYHFDLSLDETDANWGEITPAHSNSNIEVVGDPPSQPFYATGAQKVSGASIGESFSIRQGMDYQLDDNREISFYSETSNQWPDLTGSTIHVGIYQGNSGITKLATIVSPTDSQHFYIEFEDTELTEELLPSGSYRYYAYAELSDGHKVELITDGTVRVEVPYGGI